MAGAAPPALIAVAAKAAEVAGAAGFIPNDEAVRLDYAFELGDWIRSSYDLERLFEEGEGGWRILLLRRRG